MGAFAEVAKCEPIMETAMRTPAEFQRSFEVDCSAGDIEVIQGLGTGNKNSSVAFIATLEDLDQDSEQFDSVIKRLRCSLCQRLCTPNSTYVCSSGHFTCGNCCPSVVVTCTQPLGQVNGEVFGCCGMNLEVLIDKSFEKFHAANKIITRCSEWKKGCRVKSEVNDVIKHIQVCPFRQVLGCPYVDCDLGDFNVAQLVEHLISQHGSLFVDLEHADEPSNAISMMLQRAPHGFSEYSWIPVILKFQNIHFLLTMETDKENVRIWVSRLEKSKKEFDPQIQLWKKHNEQTSGKESWETWCPKVIDYNIPGSRLKTGIYHKEQKSFFKFYTEEVKEQENFFRMRAYVFFE